MENVTFYENLPSKYHHSLDMAWHGIMSVFYLRQQLIDAGVLDYQRRKSYHRDFLRVPIHDVARSLEVEDIKLHKYAYSMDGKREYCSIYFGIGHKSRTVVYA